MIVYVETSVILRKLFRQKNPLSNWENWSVAFSSEIAIVESHRCIDRTRFEQHLTENDTLAYFDNLEKLTGKINFIELGSLILQKAAQPFRSIVNTLDAIHLASALLWQEHNQKDILFLTHDTQLGRAALAMGLKTQGF